MAADTTAGVAGADEFREVLDRALRDLDRDDRSGPLLRAAGLSLRIELTDLGLVVRIWADQDGEHHLRWSFGESDDPPKLDLKMDSETANAYLQGKESLAIAIARGKVRCSGESRVALLYLPAMRLVVEPYRRQVRERYPHLALT
jgi:hypothetical protein